MERPPSDVMCCFHTKLIIAICFLNPSKLASLSSLNCLEKLIDGKMYSRVSIQTVLLQPNYGITLKYFINLPLIDTGVIAPESASSL